MRVLHCLLRFDCSGGLRTHPSFRWGGFLARRIDTLCLKNNLAGLERTRQKEPQLSYGQKNAYNEPE